MNGLIIIGSIGCIAIGLFTWAINGRRNPFVGGVTLGDKYGRQGIIIAAVGCAVLIAAIARGAL